MIDTVLSIKAFLSNKHIILRERVILKTKWNVTYYYIVLFIILYNNNNEELLHISKVPFVLLNTILDNSNNTYLVCLYSVTENSNQNTYKMILIDPGFPPPHWEKNDINWLELVINFKAHAFPA